MNKTSLLLLAVCGLPASGPAEDSTRHHFGVGLPTTINAKARFTASRATDPGPNDGSPTRDRFYNDGFNRVDSTGNAAFPGGSPSTSAYGYDNGLLQVVQPTAAPPTQGSLALHSLQIVGGDYTRQLANEIRPGVDIFYRYDLKQGTNWSVGLEAGFSYQFLQWQQSGAVNSAVDLITDTYNLGGVSLPATSYRGPINWSPGDSVIGSTPTRTLGPSTPAIVTGSRSLNLDLLQLRLGPTLDWRPTERWGLGVQTGVMLGLGFTQLNYTDRVAVPGIPTISENGSSTRRHLWAGWFNAFRVSLHLDAQWDAHLEVRHVLQNPIHHDGGQRSVALNFSEALGLVVGLGYRF